MHNSRCSCVVRDGCRYPVCKLNNVACKVGRNSVHTLNEVCGPLLVHPAQRFIPRLYRSFSMLSSHPWRRADISAVMGQRHPNAICVVGGVTTFL